MSWSFGLRGGNKNVTKETTQAGFDGSSQGILDTQQLIQDYVMLDEFGPPKRAGAQNNAAQTAGSPGINVDFTSQAMNSEFQSQLLFDSARLDDITNIMDEGSVKMDLHPVGSEEQNYVSQNEENIEDEYMTKHKEQIGVKKSFIQSIQPKKNALNTGGLNGSKVLQNSTFQHTNPSDVDETRTLRTAIEQKYRASMNEVDSYCQAQGLDEHLSLMHSQTSMTQSNNGHYNKNQFRAPMSETSFNLPRMLTIIPGTDRKENAQTLQIFGQGSKPVVSNFATGNIHKNQAIPELNPLDSQSEYQGKAISMSAGGKQSNPEPTDFTSSDQGSILIDPDCLFQNNELDEGTNRLQIKVQDKITMKDNITYSQYKKQTPTPGNEYGFNQN